MQNCRVFSKLARGVAFESPKTGRIIPRAEAPKRGLLARAWHTPVFRLSPGFLFLGADHLTLEGGGGGGVDDFWSARFFFSSNLVGRIFFFFLNSLQDIFFFLFISLQDFFSSKKCHVFTFTECIYIYIVVIVVIVQYGAAKA